VGYVLVYEADNSAFGKVDGDGGVLTELLAGLSRRIAHDQRVGIAVAYALQDMQGKVERGAEIGEGLVSVLELPDNKTERLEVRLSWRLAL
jgi:hypothetical protein